jgi:hypothetical protein
MGFDGRYGFGTRLFAENVPMVSRDDVLGPQGVDLSIYRRPEIDRGSCNTPGKRH